MNISRFRMAENCSKGFRRLVAEIFKEKIQKAIVYESLISKLGLYNKFLNYPSPICFNMLFYTTP